MILLTVEASGVVHSVYRQIATSRPGLEGNDRFIRAHTKCGGYVDDGSTEHGLLVTCVRCIATLMLERPCLWCKPPGSGRDSCEADGRCTSCGGTGQALYAEGET